MEPYLERERLERERFERELEAMGAIAYAGVEFKLVVVFEGGGVLRIDAFAYAEGGWLEANGVHTDALGGGW